MKNFQEYPFSKNQQNFLTKYNELLITCRNQNKYFISLMITFVLFSMISFNIMFHLGNLPLSEIIRNAKSKTSLISIVSIFLSFNFIYILFYSINYGARVTNSSFFRFFCEKELVLGTVFFTEFLILNYCFWLIKYTSGDIVFSQMINIYIFINLNIVLKFILSLVYNGKFYNELRNYYDINNHKVVEVKKIELSYDCEDSLNVSSPKDVTISLYSQDFYISDSEE